MCVDWNAVGAIATALAVVVALFSDSWWRWWRRPKLRAAVQQDSGCFYKTKIARYDQQGRDIGTDDAYYLRLWIENEGRGPAEDVQVFAARLHRRDAGGTFTRVEKFLPMFLYWTHRSPPNIACPRVHPRMGQHCELALIRKGHAELRLELIVEAAPHTGWHRLEPATYRLDLKIASANGSPRNESIEIVFTGLWSDDATTMFRDGVTVRRLT